MDKPTKPADYISRVDINPLWGKKHILWDLRPDVNILSGVNGIGKSTILRKMAEELSGNDVPGVSFIFEPADADGMNHDMIRAGMEGRLERLLNQYAYCKADRATFFRVTDELFAVTDKTIVRNNTEILFNQDDEILTPDKLSSGERQMLIILLTVLVQEGKPFVLFLDEPEISLHFEWQERLISIIRELNPRTQLVLTTHSPAIIMSGWVDAVTEVTDITVK